MKKEERLIYKQLIELPDEGYGLCTICRYAIFIGSCEEADIECHCGIEKIEENSFEYWSGDDCWAFKPRYSLEDTADMVGIFLQGKWPDMNNCKDYMPSNLGKYPLTYSRSPK